MLPLLEVVPAIPQLPVVTLNSTDGRDYQHNTNRKGLMNSWHDAASIPVKLIEESVRQKCFSPHWPTMDSALLMPTGAFPSRGSWGFFLLPSFVSDHSAKPQGATVWSKGNRDLSSGHRCLVTQQLYGPFCPENAAQILTKKSFLFTVQ